MVSELLKVVMWRTATKEIIVYADGTRKLWGTHKSSTTGEVKGSISMLANIAPEYLTIKRKFKTAAGDGKQVLRWWFVLRAGKSVTKKARTISECNCLS